MVTRLNKYGTSTSVGENIAYGTTGGKAIVLQLIIDDGVASRGHRENIFKSTFKFVGSATSTHVTYGTETVIDYAGDSGITTNGQHALTKNTDCSASSSTTSSASSSDTSSGTSSSTTTTPAVPAPPPPEVTLKCNATTLAETNNTLHVTPLGP
jgi:hypothetical protein